MKIEFTNNFINTYNNRYGADDTTRKRFEKRTRLFEKNPYHKVLKNHKLVGKQIGFRAFSIDRNTRVVYFVYQDTAFFVDIGTHEQVY